jgi:hypothetical protein
MNTIQTARRYVSSIIPINKFNNLDCDYYSKTETSRDATYSGTRVKVLQGVKWTKELKVREITLKDLRFIRHFNVTHFEKSILDLLITDDGFFTKKNSKHDIVVMFDILYANEKRILSLELKD